MRKTPSVISVVGGQSFLFFYRLILYPYLLVILISSLGDWIYQNPVVVDMNYLGEVICTL